MLGNQYSLKTTAVFTRSIPAWPRTSQGSREGARGRIPEARPVRLPAPFGGADAALGARGKSICPRPEPRREPPAPTALQQRGGERSSIVKLPAVGTRKINIIRNHCNWDCEI